MLSYVPTLVRRGARPCACDTRLRHAPAALRLRHAPATRACDTRLRHAPATRACDTRLRHAPATRACDCLIAVLSGPFGRPAVCSLPSAGRSDHGPPLSVALRGPLAPRVAPLGCGRAAGDADSLSGSVRAASAGWSER